MQLCRNGYSSITAV